MIKNCEQCKKEFSKPYKWSKKQWEKAKYCSHKCQGEVFKTTYKDNRGYAWKGGKNRCIECSKLLSSYTANHCKEHAINKGNLKHGLSKTKEYQNFYVKSRNRRKKSNGGSHTLEQWKELKEKFGFMCLCCKRVEPEIKLTEDHVIPLYFGGSDNIENIQPLCFSCNSRKWARAIDYRVKLKNSHE